MWIIKDWADNVMFNGKKFKDFEDGEAHLMEFFEDNFMDYEENRGEYVVLLANKSVSDIGD